MSDSDSGSDEPIQLDIPRNPVLMRSIRCVSCGASVRPILRPAANAVKAVGKPRNREAYRGVEVQAQYTCPMCGSDMAAEMRAVQRRLYEVTTPDAGRQMVRGQWVSDIGVPDTRDADTQSQLPDGEGVESGDKDEDTESD